jgi:hypothetical protein
MERSIIIPAYNKERLITRCLESIDTALAAIGHVAHLMISSNLGCGMTGIGAQTASLGNAIIKGWRVYFSLWKITPAFIANYNVLQCLNE